MEILKYAPETRKHLPQGLDRKTDLDSSFFKPEAGGRLLTKLALMAVAFLFVALLLEGMSAKSLHGASATGR